MANDGHCQQCTGPVHAMLVVGAGHIGIRAILNIAVVTNPFPTQEFLAVYQLRFFGIALLSEIGSDMARIQLKEL